VSWERVLEIAGDASVGRPHVAQAMLEKGYISSISEAFDRYIGRNGPAYVEREKLEPRQAVELLRRFQASAVIAHPRYMKDPEAILPGLKAAGLVGLEVYHKDSDAELIDRFRAMAQRHGLVATGGSDYHGLARDDEREPGDTALPDSVARQFLEKELTWVPTTALT
jgi:predicted metal-dependent phosphoesterase TrpH